MPSSVGYHRLFGGTSNGWLANQGMGRIELTGIDISKTLGIKIMAFGGVLDPEIQAALNWDFLSAFLNL